MRVYYTILSAKNLPIFDPIKPFCQRNPTFNFSLSQCKLGFYYSNAFITLTTYKYTHINVKTKKWMYLPFVIKIALGHLNANCYITMNLISEEWRFCGQK